MICWISSSSSAPRRRVAALALGDAHRVPPRGAAPRLALRSCWPLFPVQNASGGTAPIRALTDGLERALAARGIAGVPRSDLDAVLATHRIRFTGGRGSQDGEGAPRGAARRRGARPHARALHRRSAAEDRASRCGSSRPASGPSCSGRTRSRAPATIRPGCSASDSCRTALELERRSSPPSRGRSGTTSRPVPPASPAATRAASSRAARSARRCSTTSAGAPSPCSPSRTTPRGAGRAR